MTVANYRDSGGIQGAVARTAEQVFSELTPDQQDLARRQMFIRLVHVADDTVDTRRHVPRNELLLRHGDAQPALDVVIDKRLITAKPMMWRSLTKRSCLSGRGCAIGLTMTGQACASIVSSPPQPRYGGTQAAIQAPCTAAGVSQPPATRPTNSLLADHHR